MTINGEQQQKGKLSSLHCKSYYKVVFNFRNLCFWWSGLVSKFCVQLCR